VGPHLGIYVEAGDVLQVQVEQDYIGSLLLDELESAETVGAGVHGKLSLEGDTIELA
jgi:hypothetical protein